MIKWIKNYIKKFKNKYYKARIDIEERVDKNIKIFQQIKLESDKKYMRILLENKLKAEKEIEDVSKQELEDIKKLYE